MIYKRDYNLRQMVKIRHPNNWEWSSADGSGRWFPQTVTYNPKQHPDDSPSCLLEVTLLRPELDYT